MSYNSRLGIDTAYHINNTDSVNNVQKVDLIKDLGILYDSHLTFKDHIQEKINKAYSVIGLIKRNFIHMDSRTFIMHKFGVARLVCQMKHLVRDFFSMSHN